MKTQAEIIASLPSHLQPFVAHQDYDNYTARDHAAWRFLLHQLKHNLSQSAHPTYIEGLDKTGINLDAIPRIEEINDCLNKIGWRAVVVDGFLPPAIFMEFQALRVLVIAVNMRSFENMLYTPAPDIVHESAGHAPFLIDIDYAEFLQRFGEMGMRAIASQHDIDVYEAVRNLSIIKERPDATEAEIQQAEDHLNQLQAMDVKPSEATLLARLHWWTVEYGLVGSVVDYSIYGAGLLSSLGESQSCLDDAKVKKLPLTIDSIKTTYNITDPQPQLFVTESCRHLSQILQEYEQHMCFSRGGTSALLEAKEAGSVNTVQLNSGIQAAGKVSRVIEDAVGNTIYFNLEGPSQLAYDSRQLEGHGIDYHAHGFGSPVGRLVSMERCLSEYTIDELKRYKIEEGTTTTILYLSGIKVTGDLTKITRRDQKNILMTFDNCTVTTSEGDILFDPSWGTFDMAIGREIVSVYGGSADQREYPLYKAPSNKVTALQDYGQATKDTFAWYQKLRTARQQDGDSSDLIQAIKALENPDWLILFEAYELSQDKEIEAMLKKISDTRSNDIRSMIEQGLQRVC